MSGRAHIPGPRPAEQRPLASKDRSEAPAPALAPDAENNAARRSLSSAGREPGWQHMMASFTPKLSIIWAIEAHGLMTAFPEHRIKMNSLE